MPITPTYPGVYVQEIPSGVRTITGVATSVTAFLGFFARGKMNVATQIFSMADFERIYGGLDARSEAGYAIQQFFQNGGIEAWVVRSALNAAAAAVALCNDTGGATPILLVTAANEGQWGNNIRLDVDYATTDPASTFNLTVTELGMTGGRMQPVTVETFRNLIIDETKPNDALKVVNDGSNLVNLKLIGAPLPTDRPPQTGTITRPLAVADLAPLAAGDAMDVLLDGAHAGTVTLGLLPSVSERTLAWLGNLLQTLIRASNANLLSKATVTPVGSTGAFRAATGGADPGAVLTFTGGLATALGLDSAARSNVQQYQVGGGAKAAQALPNGAAQQGTDGSPPDGTALIGVAADKTGLYALENVDLFNILCIPDTMNRPDTEAAQVIAEATAYCEARRAFYIIDVPQSDKTRDQPDRIRAWLDENSTLRHRNAALYFPRPQVADPLNNFRLRLIAPSGTVAGLFARTDSERGVWKAPAGTEGSLKGVQKIEYLLTDNENDALNPLAINCLRSFPVYGGSICWGARTLDGSDQNASEWKYIPVRRTALFLEESLYRSLKWVVFEPNDEPLWAQIRLNIGAFMHNLFRQGAFQGNSPESAYLVKCDSETTTQNDIDRGIVNILVGFAPLKPAEFVIIKIQQLAGQIQV